MKMESKQLRTGILLTALMALGEVAHSAVPPGSAPASQRAADAPPLVAVTKDRDGNFRIAPPYTDDAAFTEKAGVPKGKVIRFTMESKESQIYPEAPGRNGPAAPFSRPVALYLPPDYVPGRETPFIVVQDGTSWFVKSEAANARTDLPFIPVMLDNLIHEKRVPPMVAIMINPGPGQQRSIEYDTISDKYTMFIEKEVLPKITKEHGVNFTKDPEGRATFGESSGAAAAITMAWFHPELYRRVISYSGTFVALRTDPVAAPHGAYEYHENFIPKSEPKPIRIWLQVGERDNGFNAADSGMRNWVTANNHMADVLKAKGYHYQYVFSEAVGHVNRPVQRQTLPEAFEWTWQGYKGPK